MMHKLRKGCMEMKIYFFSEGERRKENGATGVRR